MIYVTDRFKKKYQELSESDKQNVNKIFEDINRLTSRDYPEYLIALCGENGNSKWSGINKTLYHLYPNGQKNVHRMFYCYATDIDDNLREKAQIIDGVVFIDYTTKHDDEVKAARKYEKNQIQHLSRFESIEYKLLEKQQQAKPSFWFCLTSEQEDVLMLPQPSLIKGSAGTGKTIISFELLKQWVVSNETKKYLYLTYTNNLLKKAKQTFYEDGMHIDNKRVVLSDFSSLLNSKSNKTVINEQQARKIIVEIINEYDKSNNMPRDILFTDYFIYSYIRGIIKGHFEKFYHEIVDVFAAKKKISKALESCDFNINEKNRIIRQIIDTLENKNFNDKRLKTEILRNIVSLYDNKRERERFSIKVLQFFDKELIHKMSLFLKKIPKYKYFDDSVVKDKLINTGIESSHVETLMDLKNKYNKVLDDNNYIDDNDCALIILNSEILEENKYDGIIVDEVQDLTEIQIEAIVKLSRKDSKDISFFGDPNQTINPTVYDYGRFNSYVYIEKKHINRKNLKITHRCGPNLLEYINHLTQLRKKLKLTTIRENFEPAKSANKNKIDQ